MKKLLLWLVMVVVMLAVLLGGAGVRHVRYDGR